MTTENGGNGEMEARAMLDTFAGVGATHFDLTITNRSGDKESFRRSMTLADLNRALPSLLDNATRQQRNVIVRPHGSDVSFVQLDDLKADMLTRLAPAVFLILQTSPANFQAWVAVGAAEDKDFARRLGLDPTVVSPAAIWIICAAQPFIGMRLTPVATGVNPCRASVGPRSPIGFPLIGIWDCPYGLPA